MEPNELQTLRKALPKGYREMLKQRTGYSKNHIDHILHGRRFNKKVIDIAVILGEEYLQDIADTKAQINNLLTKINTIC